MNLFTSRRLFKTRVIIISVILFTGLLFIVRGIAMSRQASPLSVTQKVRNLSAKEADWQTATTAQPGDVLEYFALVQLPGDYEKTINNLSLEAVLDDNFSYRGQTLSSFALGINNANSDNFAKKLLSNNGLEIKQLKSGEFIDIKWQSRLAENVSFGDNALPLLGSRLLVKAKNFNSRETETIVSINSTQERILNNNTETVFYIPRVLGMNPREAYDSLGTGVLIAGNDLAGIKTIRLAKNNTTLVWRLISNELIEAGIPSGLPSGNYNLEFFDNKGNLLKEKLSIKILDTQNRTTVVAATPNVIKQGVRRTIVLQGIYLANAKELLAKNGQTFRLENINQINDRVLSAEIPESVKKGEYRLFVGEREQDVKLTVN